MITQIILTIITTIFIIQLGHLVEFYLFQNRKLNLPHSWGIGLGLVAITSMIMSLFTIAANWFMIIILTEAAFMSSLMLNDYRSQIKELFIQLKQAKLLLLIPFIFLVALTFTQTVWGSDAYGFWLSKAHAFWIDGKITKANLNLYWPYDHPILWPVVASVYYQVLDQSNEYLIKIIPLMTLIMLALALFQNLKQQQLLWTLILILTPFVWQNVASPEYAGNADLLLSFFLLLAAVNIFKKKYLYTVLFLFLAVLTKNDAVPALIGFTVGYLFLIICPKVYSLNPSRRGVLATLSSLQFYPFYLAIIVLLLTILWKKYYGLDNRYLDQGYLEILKTKSFTAYNWYTLHAFREEFRQLYRWGVGWWLVFFYLMIRLKHITANKSLLLVFAMIISQFCGYIWIYYITPEDQASQIATSIFRLVLQVYPISLLLAAKLANGDYSRKTK